MRIQQYLIGFAVALAAGGSFAAAPALGKDAVKAAEKRIEAQAGAERKACARLKGDAKDICQAEAKGRERVARAQLEAQGDPSPEAEKEAKEVKADVDYDVARMRCGTQKDKKAKGQCLAQAKNDREAAIRQAKIEKVETIAELKEQKDDHRKGAEAPLTPEQRFAAQKARCTMMGADRDRCMAEAKKRFNKT